MQKSTFIKYLDSLEEEELKSELIRLYELDEVKAYYKLELGSDKDRKKYYDKIKKELEAKYKTKSYRKPRRPRIAKINAILRDVEKQQIYTFEKGEIYLYNVECATRFVKEYRLFNDPLKNTILKSYEKACMNIRDALMEEEFYERLKDVIVNVQDFPFIAIDMENIFEQYFDE